MEDIEPFRFNLYIPSRIHQRWAMGVTFVCSLDGVDNDRVGKSGLFEIPLNAGNFFAGATRCAIRPLFTQAVFANDNIRFLYSSPRRPASGKEPDGSRIESLQFRTRNRQRQRRSHVPDPTRHDSPPAGSIPHA